MSIEPMLGRIATSDKSDLRRFYPDNWRSLIALQVENLVINNRNWIWNKLGLEDQDGLCDGPFQQRATKALSGVQVDYMIQTRSKTIFVCEIKFSTGTLGHEVIDEVAEKNQENQDTKRVRNATRLNPLLRPLQKRRRRALFLPSLGFE
ncbi:MAG: hypothetical protein ABL921_27655 [Pirellula sp.]